MFDISFTEMAIVGVVALIVIGPERLPKVARTAGHLFGRFQRYVATVRTDIQREIDASDLAKVKQEVDAAARVFEQSVQEHTRSFEGEMQSIGRDAAAAPAETPPVAPALPSIDSHPPHPLIAEDGPSPMVKADTAPAAHEPATHRADAGAVQTASTFAQGHFDFGIEPTRPGSRA